MFPKNFLAAALLLTATACSNVPEETLLNAPLIITTHPDRDETITGADDKCLNNLQEQMLHNADLLKQIIQKTTAKKDPADNPMLHNLALNEQAFRHMSVLLTQPNLAPDKIEGFLLARNYAQFVSRASENCVKDTRLRLIILVNRALGNDYAI